MTLPRIWIATLAFSGLALAQYPAQPGNSSGNSQSSGNLQNSPGNSPAMGSGSSNSSGSSSGSSNAPPRGSRPGSIGESSRGSQGEGISGRVLLSDGAQPDPDILVQRLCGQSLTGEAHPGSDGRFTLRPAAKGTFSSDVTHASGSEADGCELRASLSGYVTVTMALGTGHSSSGGDVMILLRRIGNSGPMTVSATTLLAPRDARKAYDKGLEAARRNAPDQAQKDFLEAVRLYPRYAAAWLELGKVYEQRDHRQQARDAYTKSAAADGGYLFPDVRLYLLDIRELRWKEAADTSAKVLRLDPYDFSEAFYFNAVANLELDQLDAAEHSAREAARLEGSQAQPRGNYVLGVILWHRGDLAGAQEKLSDFLADPSITGSPEQASARKMITQVEQQIERRMAREAAGH